MRAPVAVPPVKDTAATSGWSHHGLSHFRTQTMQDVEDPIREARIFDPVLKKYAVTGVTSDGPQHNCRRPRPEPPST